MEELNVARRRRVAVCLLLVSLSLMVVATARGHLWVTFAGIGVEAVGLVFMLREVAAMKKGE